MDSLPAIQLTSAAVSVICVSRSCSWSVGSWMVTTLTLSTLMVVSDLADSVAGLLGEGVLHASLGQLHSLHSVRLAQLRKSQPGQTQPLTAAFRSWAPAGRLPWLLLATALATACAIAFSVSLLRLVLDSLLLLAGDPLRPLRQGCLDHVLRSPLRDPGLPLLPLHGIPAPGICE